jgi:hypothetical protein
MVTYSRRLVTGLAALGVAATGFAAPASADPPLLNGIYTTGDPSNVWTIATSCGLFNGCSGSVASNAGWNSPVRFVNGRWDFTVSKPDAVICADGQYGTTVVSISIDAVSLGGVMSADSNGVCAGGTTDQTPFQLRKLG